MIFSVIELNVSVLSGFVLIMVAMGFMRKL